MYIMGGMAGMVSPTLVVVDVFAKQSLASPSKCPLRPRDRRAARHTVNNRQRHYAAHGEGDDACPAADLSE